jgi:formate hydrogenlyase subunit 4
LGANVLASSSGPAVLLAALALMVVFLAENARIPVDDPNTHLELTMIHEVMVLDHGGPDLAMIQYGACLKLWTIGWLLVGIVTPVQFNGYLLNLVTGLAGMVLLGVATGIVESVMARLRLLRVPQFLIAASVLAILALVLVMG